MSKRREQRSKRDRISTKVADRVVMRSVERHIKAEQREILTEDQWLKAASCGIFSAIPGEIGPAGYLNLA